MIGDRYKLPTLPETKIILKKGLVLGRRPRTYVTFRKGSVPPLFGILVGGNPPPKDVRLCFGQRLEVLGMTKNRSSSVLGKNYFPSKMFCPKYIGSLAESLFLRVFFFRVMK